MGGAWEEHRSMVLNSGCCVSTKGKVTAWLPWKTASSLLLAKANLASSIVEGSG